MTRVEEAPWSVPVRTGEVGRGLTRELSPDAAARARIAKALDLRSLDSLEAEVSVRPMGEGWEVSGRLQAAVVQTCGITLEPLPAEIRADFAVRLVEGEEEEPVADEAIEITLESDDPPDRIEKGVIDLGAYVVEHLALELDPFPRKPGAVFEAPEEEKEPSPFAALAKLKREEPDR